MSFRSDLYSRLSTHAGLVALISKRSYPPRKVPQNPAWPFITYRVLNRDRVRSHQGFSYLEIWTIRIGEYAQDATTTGYAQLDDINEQIIDALENWSDVNSKVQASFLLLEEDDDEDETRDLDYDYMPSEWEIHYQP